MALAVGKGAFMGFQCCWTPNNYWPIHATFKVDFVEEILCTPDHLFKVFYILRTSSLLDNHLRL